MAKQTLRVLVFLLILGIAGYAIYNKVDFSRETNEKIAITKDATAPQVPPDQKPTGSDTFLFQDMTIPHLRSRDYDSFLEGMEKVTENSVYESYVANYSSDGNKIFGLLTKPKGEMPDQGYPGIIFVHGYIPPKQYKTRSNYVSYVDYFARSGFVVFKIDLRGHDQSEGEATGAYYSGDYVVDVLSAHSALVNSHLVDPLKIGLWGHSMGGNVVFRSFVAKGDIPAVVIWAGVAYSYSDLQKYRISDDSYRPPPTGSNASKRRLQLMTTYGEFSPDHWFWKQVPATNYLESVTGAVQLNHAINDDVVDIGYSKDLMDVLDKTQIVHELKEYSSGGHNISGTAFNQAMQNSVNFFNKYLK